MTGFGVAERIHLVFKGVAKVRALTPRAKQLQAKYDVAYQETIALVKQVRSVLKDPAVSVRNNYEFSRLNDNLSSAVVKLIALRRQMASQGLCSQKDVGKLERRLNRVMRKLTVAAEVKRHKEIIKIIPLIGQLRAAANERTRLLGQIEELEPKPENAATILGLKKAAHDALGSVIATHEQLPDNGVDFPIQIERAREEYQKGQNELSSQQKNPVPVVSFKEQRLANFRLRLQGIEVPTEPCVPYVGNSESELSPIEQPVAEPVATPAPAPQIVPQPPVPASPIDIKRKARMPEFTAENIKEMVALLKQGALDTRLIRFLQLHQMIDGRFYANPDFTALFLLENASWILDSLSYYYEQSAINGNPKDFDKFKPLLKHPLLEKAMVIRKREFAAANFPTYRTKSELQEITSREVENKLNQIGRNREVDEALDIGPDEFDAFVAFQSELENSLVTPVEAEAIDAVLYPVKALNEIWETSISALMTRLPERIVPSMQQKIDLLNNVWRNLGNAEKLEIAARIRAGGQALNALSILPYIKRRVQPVPLEPATTNLERATKLLRNFKSSGNAKLFALFAGAVQDNKELPGAREIRTPAALAEFLVANYSSIYSALVVRINALPESSRETMEEALQQEALFQALTVAENNDRDSGVYRVGQAGEMQEPPEEQAA